MIVFGAREVWGFEVGDMIWMMGVGVADWALMSESCFLRSNSRSLGIATLPLPLRLE